MVMKSKGMRRIGLVTALVSTVGAGGLSAQDKYTLKVPGDGLAFSEFRGYESWEFISLSQGELVAAILGNAAMIKAYKEGYPGNGKPWPDGVKMAKVHWTPKKSQAPGTPTVPGALHDVDFMVKDSKRFGDSGGWGYAAFKYDTAKSAYAPRPRPTRRRRRTTPSVGSGATRS